MHMLFSTGRKRRWAWAGSGVAASGGSSVRSPLYGTSRFALLHTSSTYHTRRGICAGRVREVHGMIGGFNSPCSSIRNTSASVFPCTWVVREDSLAQVKSTRSVFGGHVNEMKGLNWNAGTGGARRGCAGILPRFPRVLREVSKVSRNDDVSWDPEGLFKNQSKMPLFVDSQKSDGEPQGTSSALPPLEASFLRKHPIRPLRGEGTLSDLKRFKSMLADRYMPVDIDRANVTILHIDPPILLVDEVFTPHECDDIITKLAATGRMRASTIGAGNLYGSSVSSNNRRTSSSVLINDEMMAEFPAIKAYAETLQQRAFELLQGETLGSWGRPGHAMLHRQWAFEGMQAAVYKKGQHFLEHEDAFPSTLADENRFQRHATVLLYLNTVETGGETTFSHLGVSVKPRAGSVLLFFPAFADGQADHRTLHVAQEAVDEKWVVQQWVARGFNSTLAAHAAEQSVAEARRASLLGRKALKKKKLGQKRGAGFG